MYTLWRAEWEHFTKQQLQFHKQNNEWEMLGELALRLHHKVRPSQPILHLQSSLANINLHRSVSSSSLISSPRQKRLSMPV